jgi:hypothetical protein
MIVCCCAPYDVCGELMFDNGAHYNLRDRAISHVGQFPAAGVQATLRSEAVAVGSKKATRFRPSPLAM